MKYQHILRSKNTNREIRLNLQHFAEHTNILLPLAKKIAEGIGRIVGSENPMKKDNNNSVALDNLALVIEISG